MQQPKGGDTIINKNYYTAKTPQPQVIIMEGGKGNQQVQTNSTDSAWNQRLTRLETMVVEVIKNKETKVMTAGQIVALALGATVLLAVLLVVLSKLTFK